MNPFNNNSSSQPEGTHGPHSSRLANAADPRIDSDRDNRAAPTHTTGLHEPAHHTTGLHESAHAGTGVHEGGVFSSQGTNRGFDGPATKTDGPHSSNILNKADPRVDSDRDHSRNMGANPHGTATTGTGRTTHEAPIGTSTTTGTGRTTLGGTTGTTGTTHGYNTRGTTATTTGAYDAPEGVHGPHSSRAANAADPRVDSDRDHRAAPGKVGHTTGTTGLGNTHTTGPAPNTAGPHKSDLMNKLDPRVDSDLDGSKTIGGDKTDGRAHKDPTDAAQVPPSVLQKHVGPPVPAHDEHHSHGHKEKHHLF